MPRSSKGSSSLNSPRQLTRDEIKAQLQADRWIYLAIGPNIWAKAFTADGALEGLKKSAGYSRRQDAKRYVLFACVDPWSYIDDMGGMCYTPRDDRQEHPERLEYVIIEDHSHHA